MDNWILDNSMFLLGGIGILFFMAGLYSDYFKKNQTDESDDFKLLKAYVIVEARKKGKKYHRDVFCAWSKDTIGD